MVPHTERKRIDKHLQLGHPLSPNMAGGWCEQLQATSTETEEF